MMFLMLATVAAVTASSPPATAPAPALRVAYADLDFNRPGDVDAFSTRVIAESRRVCATHRAVISGADVADPAHCERAMAAEAVRALPHEQRRLFRRAGGLPRIRRG